MLGQAQVTYASLKSKAAQMIEDGTVVCPVCDGAKYSDRLATTLNVLSGTYKEIRTYCPACSATGRVMAPRVVSIPEFDALLGIERKADKA